MGSFNTQCFATKQIIAPEDSVYLVPVVAQSSYEEIEVHTSKYLGRKTNQKVMGDYSSTCYLNKFWSPIGFLIEATYADYGKFELIDSAFNRRIVSELYVFLANKALVTKQGENQYHDVPFDLQQFAIKEGFLIYNKADQRFSLDETAIESNPSQTFSKLQSFWEFFSEGMRETRVFVKSHQKIRNLHFMVAAKTSVKTAVEYAKSVTSYKGDMPYERVIDAQTVIFKSLKTWLKSDISKSDFIEDFLKPQFKENSLAIPSTSEYLNKRYFSAVVNNTQEMIERLKNDEDFDESTSSKLFVCLLKDAVKEVLRAYGTSWFSYSGSYSGFEAAEYFIEQSLFSECVNDSEDFSPKVYELLEIGVSFSVFLMISQQMELSFEPQVYTGQDYDNEIGREYAKWVSAAADMTHKARKELYGDEEEDLDD